MNNNNINKPIFAVFEPAFMGLVENVNLSDEILKKYTGIPTEVKTDKRISLYLHDTLESLAGFDIPQLLAGIVTTNTKQECVVVLPDGTEKEAIITLRDEKYRYYGHITIPEEAKEITFNY